LACVHTAAVPTPRFAEVLRDKEIAALREWLGAQGLDLQRDAAHADEGSHERLYSLYGYFMGLRHALAMLTSRGSTLH
jgi:hypothetical protein